MEPHDLIAAYAVDALEPHERREFEQHLLTCERCRDDLPALQEAAGALAFAVDAPPPPRALRERILHRARGERPNVVPLRRQRPFRIAVAAAAVAAAAAIALAFWSVSLSRDLDRERTASADVVAVLSDPFAERVRLAGGTLVVARSRRAVLSLSSLPDAPAGKHYMAWVIRDFRARPAGLFDARDGRALHVLDEPVPPGSTVAITAESGPVEAPTSEPLAKAVVAA